MKNALLSLLVLAMFTSCSRENRKDTTGHRGPTPFALVIHGGAGTITRTSMSPEKEQQYHQALKLALDTGYAILEHGGTSVDAVLAAVRTMEDSPLFNAGRGAVFTHDGTNELDASIMDGKNRMAGAVTGIKTVRNPIMAAHAVMTRSDHVMLSGRGAEVFAEQQGLAIVENNYFFDSTRYNQLQKVLKKDAGPDSKFGTVGCVALDQFGNIAAGTSTGGMTNKKFGRIGDSPIIGAGTYANNETCGVSSTGWGEYFIRLGVAFDISALMDYKGLSLEDASQEVIMKKLPELGGNGGIIGLTRAGEIVMMFNTEGMYRGFRRQGESAQTFIYKD
jgi:L-asparaginase / beta-aspartyl-peptidase